MISLVAVTIDMMLPALPEIGRDLGVRRENDNQLIVSLLFLGLAVGQLFYGPLSDNAGRKPALYIGLGLYLGGCLLSLVARSFPVMLVGRFLQGAGAAGPRTVTMALVRDQFKGREMARVMSFVMAVFVVVPVVAPSLGQLMLLVAGWRAIFGVFLTLGTAALAWFALRQPETLTPDRRVPFSLSRMGGAVREVLANRVAFGHTLAAGLVLGAFLGYLNSSQQILQQQYALGTRFPLYFAVLALALGSASITNARLVMRYGMRPLATWSLAGVGGLSLVFLGYASTAGGHPPLAALMGYLLVAFYGIGILFGNLNALAMEPLGHIAGTGAAVVGSLSTMISLVLGTAIGQSYNGTVLPLVGGFAVLGLSALVAVRWAGRGPAGSGLRA
jgi:DHA1 family bicyclomycin/chloramphenicol resistance-like MFS transporter